MSISILPYLDEAAVAALHEQAEIKANELYNQNNVNATSDGSDFATVLREQTNNLISSAISESADLADQMERYFEEASNTYNVSKDLLKAIAKTESNFNPSTVSSSGAMGVMQLMPETAASLGVSDAFNVRENILGGAKLISQLLNKYNGDLALSLAAYNAGSGNVDKYGGIPPFTETQNYVNKVISCLQDGSSTSTTIETTASTTSSTSSTLSGILNLTGDAREEANKMLAEFFTNKGITKQTLDAMVTILKLLKSNTSSSEET